MDDADFDPDETDEEGLPLVYNEAKIAAFWKGRPGELATRWAKFARISGGGNLWPGACPAGACGRAQQWWESIDGVLFSGESEASSVLGA
jgi:hypothetical protein